MILAASPWWSTVPALGAALGYLLLALANSRMPRPSAGALMALVWLLHALALGMALGAQPARFGFAPALSVMAWLVFTVHAIESRLYPQLHTRRALAALGAGAVLLALVFPGSDYPDLRSNWLPLHWALGIAAYGLLAVAVVHAWFMQRAEKSIRQGAPQGEVTLPLLALERLTFRFVAAGFVLLTGTLLAGWYFTELLGPHGWAWTHKTVFTVLSWAVLGLLLLGRWQWGWRGRFAVRMLYAGAALLLLGYVGTRFVIEVVLQRS
ncbi:MAG: cytochrome c biogenesis protein CcsA [Serpentinimonas sp.]|jgi:ABC-type uncharacterized transport system permease subunit|nr:cytochrome c biogenesis protein CcsA [Serpentinimonas sp.]